jgi:hypothetical protein
VGRVLGANEKPKAESADRESPSRSVVAAPMADEPGKGEGDQPDATNPNQIMPHLRICDLRPGVNQAPLVMNLRQLSLSGHLCAL